MNLYSKLALSALACTLFSVSALAQRNALRAGLGLSTIRGEFSHDNPFQDSYSPDYTFSYLRGLGDEKWQSITEFSYSQHDFSGDLSDHRPVFLTKNGTPVPEFHSEVKQLFIGTGLRFYMSNSINKYNPYRGQFLPYIGVMAGISRNTVFQEGEARVPEGYVLNHGSATNFALQVDGGFMYVLNEYLAIEVFGAIRPNFTDETDGVSGITNFGDWTVKFGAAVQYRF